MLPVFPVDLLSFRESASEIFQSGAEKKESKPYTKDDLIKKIGRLEIGSDFLRNVSTSRGTNPEKLKLAIRIRISAWIVS